MSKVKLTVDQEQKLKTVPRRFRELYRKAATGSSRRAAIRVFCLECVAWVTHEVDLCTGRACPLFPYRTLHITSERGSEKTSTLAQGPGNRAVVGVERAFAGEGGVGDGPRDPGRSRVATSAEEV